jgi:hypothetical protein
VEELQARMSGREFAEWIAFARLEPWGFDPRLREERADLRVGVLTSLVYNRTRGEKEPAKDPQDFVLQYGEAAKKPLSAKARAEKLLMMARTMTALFGGEDKTRRN